MADGEGRAREGEGEGEEGEAFYLSRKTFTTKMGGAGEMQKVVSERESGANETAF